MAPLTVSAWESSLHISRVHDLQSYEYFFIGFHKVLREPSNWRLPVSTLSVA